MMKVMVQEECVEKAKGNVITFINLLKLWSCSVCTPFLLVLTLEMLNIPFVMETRCWFVTWVLLCC
jgi:hypothetical protein